MGEDQSLIPSNVEIDTNQNNEGNNVTWPNEASSIGNKIKITFNNFF